MGGRRRGLYEEEGVGGARKKAWAAAEGEERKWPVTGVKET